MTIPNYNESDHEQARPKRPEPERDRPDRRPSGFARSAAPAPNADAAQRTVEASVQGAYRVIEDYLRWGQRSAAQWSNPPVMQNPNEGVLTQALQMFQVWQQMYMQWMSMVGPAMQGPAGRPQPMHGPGMPFGPSMPAPNMQSFGPFGVELNVSDRVASLSLQLQQPLSGAGTVRLQCLEGPGEICGQLDEQGTLRLALDPSQVAGHYSGRVLDRQGRPCGDLELTLCE